MINAKTVLFIDFSVTDEELFPIFLPAWDNIPQSCVIAVISAFPEKRMNVDGDVLNDIDIANFVDDEVQESKRGSPCYSPPRFWLKLPCYVIYKPKIKITPILIERMKSFFRNRFPQIQLTPILVARLTSILREYLKQNGRLAD